MNRTNCHRRGVTLLSAIVVVGVFCFALYFALAGCNTAHVKSRQNTCRSNLSNLARAMIEHEGRNGRLPGYMNCLITQDGSPYPDPDTNEATPVSWVVELLTDIDRGPLYEMWRTSYGNQPTSTATASATGTAAATPTGTAGTPYRERVKIFLEPLICPDDSNKDQRSGTPLSYVVNSGMPDLPEAIPAASGTSGSNNGAKPTVGMPRDWQANGMFFDNYSDDKLIKTPTSKRGPQIVMQLSRVRDPKGKTILVTENLDATSYVFESWDFPKPGQVEIVWGSVWAPGKSTPNPNTETHTTEGNIFLEPRDDVSLPNAHNDGRKHPLEYKYCRPSSPHDGGFNVAFAGKNVMLLKDTISYFVYARLMASDDAGTKLPGSQALIDANFRGYLIECGDGDFNP